MNDGIAPLFILSMPRSGSTLLQRLIGAAPSVSTHAEPWILLPLLEHLVAEDRATGSRYDGATADVAISEFVDRLGNGRLDLLAGVRAFAGSVYGSASDAGVVYYLDKTPRYAAYIDELLAAFPEARYIILQRDIREVIASIIRTWGGGQWNIFLYLVDLVDGFDRLARLQRSGRSNLLVVEFDDLVSDLPAVARRLADFLDIAVDARLLPADAPVLDGSVGDRSSAGRRSSTAVRPVDHWEDQFRGVVRRAWLRAYLRQRRREGADVPEPPHIGITWRLVDRPSDLALVPLTLVWPTLNRLSGWRLESAVRSRRSTVVRAHRRARPSRRVLAGRVRAWHPTFARRTDASDPQANRSSASSTAP